MLAGAAAAAVIMPAPAAAQATSFSIPAQDLAGALQQFALRIDGELLYSPDLVANRRTSGLSGSYTPEDALRRLLTGTGLGFRRTGPNTFVLTRSSAAVQPAAAVAPANAQVLSQAASRAPAREQGALTGAATDRATGSPLAGALVRVQGTNLTAVTDEAGIYRFPAIPVGDYLVVLEYLGSPDQSAQAVIEPGVTTQLNFTRGGEEEGIVVVGHVSAIQRALNQQRTALNNAAVVSEDFLGGFPAETVSEALRRVPGVAFGRDDDTGEGSRILIRGFSSEAINVQVNGLDLQGTNFERTVDLSGFLAENISTVTIHRSLLPSHEATGSGGLVEIETRSGLDYGDFHFSASVEGERPFASGFGREYQASATVGGRVTSNLGVVGMVSYRDTSRLNFDIVNQSIGTTPPVLPAGYTSLFNTPASLQFPFDPEFNSRLNTSATYMRRDREETNLAASINVAWDVADHTRLRLDLQHNARASTNFFSRSSVQFLATPGFDMPIPELGGEVRRRFTFNSLRPGLSLAEYDQDVTTNTISLRGDTDIERWQFRYKAGYSGARNRQDNNAITLLGNIHTNLRDIIDPSTIRFARDDDAARTERIIEGGFIQLENGAILPSLTPLGQTLLFDPGGYRVTSATRSIADSPTDAWIAEGSARYAFESWLDYLEVGFKYDRSSRSALDDLFAANPASLRAVNSFSPISGRNTFISDLGSNLLGSTDLGMIGLGGFMIPSMDRNANDVIFARLENLLADDPSTPFNEARFNYTDISDFDPITDVNGMSPARSSEERLASYLESHVEFGQFDIVGGARIERTQRVGSAISIPQVTLNQPGFQREPRETFVAAGLVDFVNLNVVNTTITPSFLINFRPRSNIVARLGYFRSTVQPSLQLLRRQTQYLIDLRPSNAQVILREGNPDLEPTTTDNWDFDVAYYFQDSPGLVRAGLFYKRVNNNFTNVFVQDQPAAEVRERVLEYFEPLIATRPDLVDFADDTNFLFSRPVNGEGGTIWGFELELIRQFNFLPGFLSGFGVIGNLTYTNGDFPTLVSGRDDAGNLTNFELDRPLQDQAAWVYNAALTYSRGGFEGRLIYTRQSATVTAYEIHDLNTVIPAYSTLDLRMSYNFDGPGGGLYTLFLEGDDLLRDADDPDIRSATSNTFGREDAQFFFPNTLQFTGGRTITLGARVRF